MSGPGEGDERGEPATEEPAGTSATTAASITRVYYGSESGLLRSEATQREYAFRAPFVEIRGPIPARRRPARRHGGRLRPGVDVGGPRVTVIRVFD